MDSLLGLCPACRRGRFDAVSDTKKPERHSRGDKFWLAKISEAQGLYAKEQAFAKRAKRFDVEATVQAFRLGKLVQELDKGYGKKAIINFAEDSSIPAGTLRDRIYLYRGCVDEGHIRRWPHMTPDYYKTLGSSINGFFPDKRDKGRHWMLDYYVHGLLLTNPPVRAKGDRVVSDDGALKEAKKMLDDFHARVRSSRRLSWALSESTCGWIGGKEGGMLAYSYPTGSDSKTEKVIGEFALEIEGLGRNIFSTGGKRSRVMNPGAFNRQFEIPHPKDSDFVQPKDEGPPPKAREIIEKDGRRRFLNTSQDLATPEGEGVIKERLIKGKCHQVLAKRKDIFPTRSVDVVVADPPYSREYYKYIAWRGYTEVKHDAEATIKKQASLVGKVARVLVENAIIKEQFIWFSFFPMDYAHVFVPPILDVFEKEYGDGKDNVIHQILTWNKVTGTKVDNLRFMRRDVEGILYVNVGKRKLSETEDGKDCKLHSTMLTCPVRNRGIENDENRFFWKPIPLLQRLICLATHEDDNPDANAQVVLDPFAGSGSTAIAAIRCKRDYRLIESHKGQFATAKANLRKELNGKGEPPEKAPKGEGCPWLTRCFCQDED